MYIQVEQHCALGARGCGGKKRRDREGTWKNKRESRARESNDSTGVTYLRHAGGTRAFTRVNRLVYLLLGRAPSSSSPRLIPKRKGHAQTALRDTSAVCTKLR